MNITISREDFEAYEKVRSSNEVNMLDINRVSKLSGLTRQKIYYIMKNYTKFKGIFR
jgi:hypothetical protein